MTEFLSGLSPVIDLVFGLFVRILDLIVQYPLLTLGFAAVVLSAGIGGVIHLKRGVT